jgi:hypothetical protein
MARLAAVSAIISTVSGTDPRIARRCCGHARSATRCASHTEITCPPTIASVATYQPKRASTMPIAGV